MEQPTIVSKVDIQAFVALFDGDSDKAIQAISVYSKTLNFSKPKQLHRPLGDILVKLTDVKKTYKIGRQSINALDGVSLKIHQGEFVALTGASGSGKSTLLQLIGGLDKPTGGIVEVDNVNLQKLRDGKLSKFRNKTIGFVFQFFYLQPFLKVGTNLEVPAMFARTKRKVRHSEANRLAKAVGLEDRMTHLPRELSGGQMQRAAIARALFNKPKILLADEPTGNLDSKNGAAIIEIFETIRKEFGTTIVIVTHDAQIAARADREIKLMDGRII
jgi:ABC-type lipoprotein export system ATPase subunit